MLDGGKNIRTVFEQTSHTSYFIIVFFILIMETIDSD